MGIYEFSKSWNHKIIKLFKGTVFGFKENCNIAYVGVFGGVRIKIVIHFIGFILCSKQDEMIKFMSLNRGSLYSHRKPIT